MEDVQRQSSHESIAHGVLLIQMPLDGSGLLVPPCSPFIYEQTDLLLRVLLVHDGTMLLDDVLNFETLAQRPVVFVVVVDKCRALRAVPTAHGVVVQRHAVHLLSHAVHQHARPVVVVVGSTRCNLVELVAVVVAAVGLIAAIEVGVVFRAHVSAAAPRFVSYAEVFHLPCLVASVLAAQLSHWRVAVARHVFHPFGHLFDRAATNVTADVGLAADEFAEVQELVRTEGVVLDGAAPVVVLHFGTLRIRADSIAPVVFVGEASAWPAQHGNLQVLQRFQYVVAIALRVGDWRILAYPQTSINTCAEVFGKLSVDFLVDCLRGIVGTNAHGCILGTCRCGHHRAQYDCQ